MPLRSVIVDLKTFPATLAFCLAWIVVFCAMVAVQMIEGWPQPWRWSRLMLGLTEGHRFGDLTIADIRAGEYWRFVTCTFVHYGLVHLGLNLFAMYQLGALIESWYGTSQTILIYVLTGGLGNLISILARMAIQSEERLHAGGGSVVILGLVGLCAVVGWRSRTRMGVYLGQQMVSVMVLTAVLGIALPFLFRGVGVGVDNWGHAGGAIVGCVVAFGHTRLVRNANTPRGWELGLLSSILILGCGLAQVIDDRAEGPARREERARLQSEMLAQAHGILKNLPMMVKIPQNSPAVINFLDQLEPELSQVGAASSHRTMKALAVKAAKGPLPDQDIAQFAASVAEALPKIRKDYEAALRKYWSIRQQRLKGLASPRKL